jgi:anti-sigma28 factor (negative regulator of flagellin synthesis)
MSQINSIGGSTPVQKVVENPIQKQLPTDAAAPMRATDRLELSGASHLLAALKSNDVRTDKVSDIRAQIQAGTYDADGSKMDGAIDKLLDDLNK